ncbi:hypothetical protein K504DRAFT_451806 [Pleomassaria siparia CBS 279.74]|uniref:Uncharacterized protein n=1 Tax=Pleomassaria siparia CBS 279.74 TaxID=1314801 RepID=A0A6G1JSP2_9PLEO|nr:hypothetical protein K504DRAFT_451806 [Pleomassaria siparia CBS 279.74]
MRYLYAIGLAKHFGESHYKTKDEAAIKNQTNTRSLVDVNTIYRQKNKKLVNNNVSSRLQANGKVSLTVPGDGDVEMDDGGNVLEDKNDHMFNALCNIYILKHTDNARD